MNTRKYWTWSYVYVVTHFDRARSRRLAYVHDWDTGGNDTHERAELLMVDIFDGAGETKESWFSSMGVKR